MTIADGPSAQVAEKIAQERLQPRMVDSDTSGDSRLKPLLRQRRLVRLLRVSTPHCRISKPESFTAEDAEDTAVF
ncbi:hypothetical protein [Chitinimonas koreensis]|uniref:hypothetical protein n=1 Tax=Chitinimonas koreensis TaxID=356302 RepID=UPI0003F9D76A|nr:hypothetical protein [Chitinimonas koreensis]QNM96821.1 hypothetical protein H9L41_00195 [Chitinimonas koreensis]